MHSLIDDIAANIRLFGCDPTDIEYVRYRDATTPCHFDDSKNTYCYCTYPEFKKAAGGLQCDMVHDTRLLIMGRSWWMESDPSGRESWKFRRMPFKPVAHKFPSREHIAVATNLCTYSSNII